MIDRREMKDRARLSMRNSSPSIYVAALVLIVITNVVSVLSIRLNYPGLSLRELVNAYTTSNFTSLYYYEIMRPSTIGSLLDLVLSIMLNIITIGFSYCCISISRSEKASVGMLFDPFSFFLKCFFLVLVIGIFTMLWSLLLIIPGIIAAYRYRFAIYFLIDDPNREVMECIRMSKEITNGCKWQLFVLDLSFFGWSLLTIIPFVSVFVMPYMETTNAHYFNVLIGYTPSQPPPADTPPSGGGRFDSRRDPWDQ